MLTTVMPDVGKKAGYDENQRIRTGSGKKNFESR
jgi:hypothetical protein